MSLDPTLSLLPSLTIWWIIAGHRPTDFPPTFPLLGFPGCLQTIGYLDCHQFLRFFPAVECLPAGWCFVQMNKCPTNYPLDIKGRIVRHHRIPVGQVTSRMPRMQKPFDDRLLAQILCDRIISILNQASTCSWSYSFLPDFFYLVEIAYQTPLLSYCFLRPICQLHHFQLRFNKFAVEKNPFRKSICMKSVRQDGDKEFECLSGPAALRFLTWPPPRGTKLKSIREPGREK